MDNAKNEYIYHKSGYRRLKQNLSEIQEEIRNCIIPLQCRYGTAQSNEEMLQLTIDEIILRYCKGQYITNKV